MEIDLWESFVWYVGKRVREEKAPKSPREDSEIGTSVAKEAAEKVFVLSF